MGALRWNGPGVMEAQSSEWKVLKSLPMEDDFLAARACRRRLGLAPVSAPSNPSTLSRFTSGYRRDFRGRRTIQFRQSRRSVLAPCLIEWLPKPTNTGSSRDPRQVPVVEVVASCHLGDVLAQALGVPRLWHVASARPVCEWLPQGRYLS